MTDAEPQLNILALNSGSSSLKFGLYRLGSSWIERLLSGEAEAIGDKISKFHAQDSGGNALLSEIVPIPSQREAILRIQRLLVDSKMPVPAAIGHRIVHGGPRLRQHCLIDDLVSTQLEAAIGFAPLHIPAALSLIRFARDLFSGTSTSGVFRHGLSRRIAGGRAGASSCQGIAGGRNSALRISRPFVRIDCASTCERSAEPSCDRASRKWRKRDCG